MSYDSRGAASGGTSPRGVGSEKVVPREPKPVRDLEWLVDEGQPVQVGERNARQVREDRVSEAREAVGLLEEVPITAHRNAGAQQRTRCTRLWG